MGERGPRLFLLPATAGLESTNVRLGPRGERFRFSTRSAWATFGLPGRRYSWIRDVSFSAARLLGKEGKARPSLSGRESEVLRLLRRAEEERRDAAAAAAGAMQQLDSMVHFWRDMPAVPSAGGLAEAAAARPFEFEEDPPCPPDLGEERAAFEERVRSEVRCDRVRPGAWPAVLLGVGLSIAAGVAFAWLGAGALSAPLGALVGAATGAALLAATARASWWCRERSALRRLDAEWPVNEERASAAFRFAWAEWDLRRAQARVVWHAVELERVGRVRRLRAGDLDASRDCLEATLADLDFPYQAACEVATDGETAFLLVDLPPLDAVVPLTRAEVDEDLALAEVLIDEAQRHETYAEHVAGVALLLARAAFAASPRLRKVQLAGYRQGAEAGAVEYVLDVLVDRESVVKLDPAKVDPDAYLTILPGRFQQCPNHELAPLPPPPWLSQAFGAHALEAADAIWKN